MKLIEKTMEQLAWYFENIPSWHRSLILFGGLAFFLLLENGIPFFYLKYNRWLHTTKNIFFTLTTVIVNFGMAFILLNTAQYTEIQHFGLIHWLGIKPLWVQAFVGVLLLDFIGAYLIHWIQHHVKWMWKFHIIHHSDLFVDASTANRHHPGESVFRFLFTTVAVLISGAPLWVILLYQSLSALLSQFNHANICIGSWLNKPLSWLIVTPEMHRSHHHYALPYTNSNYGNLFSCWDRLFGTYIPLKNDKIIFGLDTHMNPKENDQVGNLLAIPFQPYRPPLVGAENADSEADLPKT